MPKTTVGSKVDGKKKAKLLEKADGDGKNVSQVLEELIDKYLNGDYEIQSHEEKDEFAFRQIAILERMDDLEERIRKLSDNLDFKELEEKEKEKEKEKSVELVEVDNMEEKTTEEKGKVSEEVTDVELERIDNFVDISEDVKERIKANGGVFVDRDGVLYDENKEPL